MDWGGLQREFFTLVGRQLTDPDKHFGGSPLFKAMGTSFSRFLLGGQEGFGARRR